MKERLLKFLSVKIYVFTIMAVLAYARVPAELYGNLTMVALAFFGARALQYYLWEKKK